MKHLLNILSVFAIAMLVSCGDFYTFETEEVMPDDIQMKVEQDTVWLMVGDSYRLSVNFTPDNISNTAVYWAHLNAEDSLVEIRNDSIFAIDAGSSDIIVLGDGGSLCDTLHVEVLDRWNDIDLSHEGRSDMVIYADIAVGGAPLDTATQQVAAFVQYEFAGMAHMKSAHGINYAEMRLWSFADTDIGKVLFRCYDKSRYRLYTASQRPTFTALEAYGTLSSLYSITF